MIAGIILIVGCVQNEEQFYILGIIYLVRVFEAMFVDSCDTV